MKIRRRTYSQWRAERDANADWAERVDRSLPTYRRRRARERKEAELLRERGTTEGLVGPTIVDDAS